SDLRDVVGASSVVVPAGSSATAGVKYPLTFSPLVSGSYFGSVTFTNEATREYLWYTVEAAVSPPEPETTLEMRAAVRGAVGVEIRLNNPLDSATTFTVELRGRGLLGPSTFTLEARQSGVYELVYSPLLVTGDAGQGEEGAILFASDAVGQFWYRLQLVANAAEPQTLDDMTCAVGDVCTQPLWLQNPSDRELTLQYRVTNTRNFSIKGPTSSKETAKASTRVMIPPFGRASVVVEYTPSSLSDFESTSIIFFESGVASDWEFTVRGHGRAPSVMKPLVVTARVQEAASTLFTFRNPFAAPLRVDVKLIAEENGSSPTPSALPLPSVASTPSPVFDMLLKKRRVLLESFGLLQVPISFLPRAVSETRAELVICGSDEYAELEWRYPLRGVAEAPLHPRALATLACQARDSVEKRVECELLAAPTDMVLEDESFSVEWDVDAERFGAMTTAAAIERALTVTPQPLLGSSPSRSTVALSYLLRFDPLRPYRGSVALLIRKKSGGLWRFEVALDAGDPPVDDVLSIESSLNQTSSVTFQLRNQFREPAAFQAEFSAGSSSAFTVYPVQGVLPPYGSADGAAFVVSFTPTGYGKMQSGQLAIVTEEMQWTFNTISSLNEDGDGVGVYTTASSPEMQVVVPFTAPGDELQVELWERDLQSREKFVAGKRREAWPLFGQLVEVSTPSAHRVAPLCHKYFGACGGCKVQHVAYAEQRRSKQTRVLELFATRRHSPDMQVRELLGVEAQGGVDEAAAVYHYRNKMEFTCSTGRWLLNEDKPSEDATTEGDLTAELPRYPFTVGMFPTPSISARRAKQRGGKGRRKGRGAWSPRILSLDECLLQAPACNRVLQQLVTRCEAAGLQAYDFHSHEGFLKQIVLRRGVNGQGCTELMLGLVTTTFDGEQSELLQRIVSDLVDEHHQELLAEEGDASRLVSIVQTLDSEAQRHRHGAEQAAIATDDDAVTERVLSGRAHLEDSILGHRFEVSFDSFFQPNSMQAGVLYREIQRMLAALPEKPVVWDLFCGVGSIGICMGALAEKVVGFELVEAAVERAKVNARLNGYSSEKMQFFCVDLAKNWREDELLEQIAAGAKDGEPSSLAAGRPDLVIVDPPRAGLHKKLIKMLRRLAPRHICYVSCNPQSQVVDLEALCAPARPEAGEGGVYRVQHLQPVDMVPHTPHIETIAWLERCASSD
ncbi:hypothetical protein BBJ28_00010241, partial [Nothophytophthora sp. Chile5]